MNFSSEQIAPGKWGIYSASKLLATVSSQTICDTVMANLASGRKDLPVQDVNALYRVSTQLKSPLASVPSSCVKTNAVKADSAKANSTRSLSIENTAQAEGNRLIPLSEQTLEEALVKAPRGATKGVVKATV
ncbi:MAG: hypothetical protein AAF703_04060 [Cyanobacteria bacterium P01_D01_bin.105]